MKVKICGMTRPEDIKICEKANTDLIGFINIERSKRFLNLAEITELISMMENKKKAVLVIEPKDLKEAETTIEKLAIDTVAIDTVQLHSLSSDDVRRLKHKIMIEHLDQGENKIKGNQRQKMPLNIIKAIGIPETITVQKRIEIEDFARVSDALLFDYEIHGKSGGTGKQIPLELAFQGAKIAKNTNKNIKLFLAGGMNPEQIESHGKLIDEIFDFIDVNSGVEDQPGLKNPERIEEMMQKVKCVNTVQND